MRSYGIGFSASCCLALVWACSDQAPATTTGNGGSAGSPSGGVPSGVSGTAPGVSGTGVGVAGTGVALGGGGASGAAGNGGSAAGNGGSSGAGGTGPYMPPVSSVTCPPAPVGGSVPLIADFEDGLEIIPQDGRGGIWFNYSDGTGTQSSPLPVVASDRGGQAMHVIGKNFTNWGSGIGSAIAFDFGKNVQCPYDASLFDGITVRVKGEGTAYLRMTQVEMTPATAGDRKGSCDPNKNNCEGHYEVAIELTDSWTLHSYEWSDLKQPFGNPTPFEPKSVLGVSFEFHAPLDYDFWLDDVAFLQLQDGAGGAGGAGGTGAGGASD